MLVVDSQGQVLHAGEELLDWLGGRPVPEPGEDAWTGLPASVVTQRRLVLSVVAWSGTSVWCTERVADRWACVAALRLAVGGGPAVAFLYRDADREIEADEELKRLRLRILTVQEEERRAISQQLHDELGQRMT